MSEPTPAYTTPSAPAVAPEAGGPIVVRMPDDERARIKERAQAAKQALDAPVADNETVRPGVAAHMLGYFAVVGPEVALSTLAYVEHLESHAAALTTQLAEARALTNEAVENGETWLAAFRAAESENTKLAARLHDEQAASAEQERQMLLRDEELRKLKEQLEMYQKLNIIGVELRKGPSAPLPAEPTPGKEGEGE